MYGDTQFQGVSSLFLEFDSMRVLSVEESYQFDPGIFQHAVPCFYSEPFVKDIPNLHYESQESYFVFPAEPVENFYLMGETKGHESFSLPQVYINQNQIFDRGRDFVHVRWPGAILCI